MEQSNMSTGICPQYADVLLIISHPATLPVKIAVCAVSAVMAVVLICSNGVIFVAFAKEQRLRSPSNVLLISLAITDFITGLMVQPLFFAKEVVSLQKSVFICKLEPPFIYFMSWSMGTSLVNIALISLDRYIAIFNSLRYAHLVTLNRVLISVVVCHVAWSVSNLLPISGLIPFDGLTYIIMVVVIPCLVFTVFVNIRLLTQARKQRILIEAAAQSQYSTSVVQSVIDAVRTRKRSQAVGYIAILVILCYSPECINIGLKTSGTGDGVTVELMFGFTHCLILLNGCINPFIYCWRDRRMRRVVNKILRRRRNAVGAANHQNFELTGWGPTYW